MGRAGDDAERLLRRLDGRSGRGRNEGWSDGWSDGDDVRGDGQAVGGSAEDTAPGGEGAAPGRTARAEDPFPVPPAGAAPGRGRRADRTPVPSVAWRLLGVPPGLVVALLAAAVVLVVVLGRAGGDEELVVGVAEPPGATTASSARAIDVPGGEERAAVDGAPADGPPADTRPDATDVPGSLGDGAPGPLDGADASTGAAAGAQEVVVHVDGAVDRPGLVRLPPGARVADAVAAAGGVTDEADTRLVNLARPVADGELVVVPRPGEQALDVAAPGSGAGDERSSGAPDDPVQAGGLVDLNTADAAALDTLPGIGPALAGRIVTFRTESGPFVSVEDVTSVSGIGPAVLAGIRDLVTV